MKNSQDLSLNSFVYDIISIFSDFLDEKGIVIPNYEKIELLSAGIKPPQIFGKDREILYSQITDFIKKQNIEIDYDNLGQTEEIDIC